MRRFRLPDRADVIPVIVIIAVAVAAAIAMFIWLDQSGKTTYAAAQPVFDHSNCQYPNRLSNPPDGCDNTDPARPECMKFGTEDCSLPYNDGTIPTTPASVAPAASQSVKTSTCTGN